MAKFSSILAPGEKTSTYVSLATVTASAEQAIGGIHNIIAFVADQACTISWGVTTGNVTTPSLSVGQFIPANSIVTFDTSKQFAFFKFFNTSASTANVYWWHLSTAN